MPAVVIISTFDAACTIKLNIEDEDLLKYVHEEEGGSVIVLNTSSYASSHSGAEFVTINTAEGVTTADSKVFRYITSIDFSDCTDEAIFTKALNMTM